MQKTKDPNPLVVTLILSSITFSLLWLRLGDDVLLGIFQGPDDYMRLIQVNNWTTSHGWFDFSISEIYHPQPLDLHWSRFPDLFIAGVSQFLSIFFDAKLVTPLTVTVVPFMLFTVFLFSIAWASVPLLGKSNSLNAALFGAFSLTVLTQFAPGRVDHHQLQLILLALVLGCMLRIQKPNRPIALYASSIGILFAIALWIGTEFLPWMIATCSTFWIFWLFGHKDASKAGFWVGLNFIVCSILILGLSQPPGQRLTTVCDSHSLVSVGISALVFTFWSACLSLNPYLDSPLKRFAFSSALAVSLLAAFFIVFPQCTESPYGDIDPILAEFWIPNISEAMNIFSLGADAPQFVLPNLIALLYLIYLFFYDRKNLNTRMIVLTIFLTIGILLGSWQARFFPFTQVISILIVAHLATRIWTNIDPSTSKVKHLSIVIGTVFVFGPVPGILVTTLLENKVEKSNRIVNTENCSALKLVEQLQPFPPTTKVGTFIQLGSELIFHGGFHVPGAPYHRNSVGNSLVFNLFSSETDEEAERITKQLDLDIIAICADHPEFSFYTNRGFTTFAERLNNGNYPKWLIPLPDSEFHTVFSLTHSPDMTSHQSE